MNQNIKAFIIDDEPKAVKLLESYLKSGCPDVEITGSASSVQTALPMIKELKPNLIFTDIEMPVMNGIELMSMFNETEFAVIYITAYENYAVSALKINTVDYLLKPLREKDLIIAVEKAKRRITDLRKLNSQNGNHTTSQKFAIPDANGLVMIEMKNVIYCKGEGSYTTFYMFDGNQHVVSHNLGEFEKQFSQYNFIRVHNSYLVNVEHVRRYLKGRGGIIIMSDRTEIDVAIRKKAQLLEALQGRITDL